MSEGEKDRESKGVGDDPELVSLGENYGGDRDTQDAGLRRPPNQARVRLSTTTRQTGCQKERPLLRQVRLLSFFLLLQPAAAGQYCAFLSVPSWEGRMCTTYFVSLLGKTECQLH